MAEKKKEKSKEKEKKAAPSAPKKKGGMGFLIPPVLGLAAIFFLPATLVIVCGMLPAAVIFLTDRSQGKNMAVAVGALNLTGVVNILIILAQKGLTLDYAMQILREPSNWLVMWGGAGIGYALFSFIPPVVAQVLAFMADYKIQKLKANQVELAKIWGDKVKGQ